MITELRPSSNAQRLAGGAAMLIVLALLAFLLARPIARTLEERTPEDVVLIEKLRPEAPRDVRPDLPLPDVDPPAPTPAVSLPEFEDVVVSQALPSVAPATSSDASPAPSGASGQSLAGKSAGTGATNGSGAGDGAKLVAPVRTGGADMPFTLKSADRAGRVTSLNFCVTEAGRVSHVQLAASSGFRDMDMIAVDWLGKQRFTPGTLGGVNARMCATYDIRWSFSKATDFEARDAADAQARTIRSRTRYPRQFVYWPDDRPFPGCDAVTICQLHPEVATP